MKISKLEYYLPEYVLSNRELHTEFPDWDKDGFEKKIGIKNRHIAKANETALDLGFYAAEKLLIDEDKKKIDFVLFCTQSPDYFLPTGACILQDRLGLNTNCGALDFNLGCSGFVYGLSIAKGLIAADIASNVLFITAETYSKHIHKKDKSNRAIFGDGASACIIEKSKNYQIGNFVLNTDGSGYNKLITKNGGFRNPIEDNPLELNYGTQNCYTNNNLYMDGPEIFNFTIENIPKLIDDTLKKNNYTIEEIDYFIYHQANAFMLNFLRNKSKIPKEKFYIDLTETGNTVSSTIPIALKQALNTELIKKGDKVMIAGFGVGLSWGATIIEI